MQFAVRFFDWNPSDSRLLCHTDDWEIESPDDASGREIVRTAMRRAGWPEVPYRVKFEQVGHFSVVEVDIPERSSQLISLTIEDVAQRFSKRSFAYVAPVKPKIVRGISSRISMLAVFLACLVGLLFVIPRHLWCAIFTPEKAKGIAIAIDRAANGALNGDYGETISSRANRARLNKLRWGCYLCAFLDWIKKGHCEQSAGK